MLIRAQDSKEVSTFKPPHTHSTTLAARCMDELIRLTHDHPQRMKYLVILGGIASLALIAAPWLVPALGGAALTKAAIAGTSIAGSLGTIASLASGYMQHYIFGFPAKDEVVYKEAKFAYGEAKAELIINKDHMPLLRIESKNSYDAGYAEGHILGSAIQKTLKPLESLYNKIRIFLRTPKSTQGHELHKYLQEVIATIPKNYLDEMRGKVNGYNAWLEKNYPTASRLSFEFYLLLQLQPDLRNYNPLLKNGFCGSKGCTSLIFKVGDYTVFTRVLDWASFGISNYYLQIERSIAGAKTTTDIGFPVVSGLLTAINENGLLIQINVSNGRKVKKAEGMPAVFFNRYCAEHASNIQEIEKIIDNKKPLSAYHMTTTNGKTVKSFHFYNCLSEEHAHEYETLKENEANPVLLAVANHGVQVKDGKAEVYNYEESTERKENAHAFFAEVNLQKYIDKQKDQKTLSNDDIVELEKIAITMARLPLINNLESTLCALFVYHKDQLIDARAATDNNFAAERPFDKFSFLTIKPKKVEAVVVDEKAHKINHII